MRRDHAPREKTYHAGRKTDLVFIAVALVLVAVMAFFLFRYLNLRQQNQTPPEEYGVILQDFNVVKDRKITLESEVDSLTKELNELNGKISSLSGN
jgi:hypothetical protein